MLAGLRCIRNIEKLGGALKILDLSYNDLSDLSPISLLRHLEDLDLSQNNLYVFLLNCFAIMNNVCAMSMRDHSAAMTSTFCV